MAKLIKVLCVSALLLSLSACYRVEVQQGNKISQEMINQLKPGMTRQQVTDLLGDTVLDNVFGDVKLTYVYTLKPGVGHFQRRKLELYFHNNKLVKYTGDYHPSEKETKAKQKDTKKQ